MEVLWAFYSPTFSVVCFLKFFPSLHNDTTERLATLAFSVMLCLGEMITFLPVQGGHVKLAERFVGPSWSFAVGWLYWINWALVFPAELVAVGVIIGYWDSTTNSAVCQYSIVSLSVRIHICLCRHHGCICSVSLSEQLRCWYLRRVRVLVRESQRYSHSITISFRSLISYSIKSLRLSVLSFCP